MDLRLRALFAGVVFACSAVLHGSYAKIGLPSDVVHYSVGTAAIKKVSIGDTLIWENVDPPTITSFSVFPDSVDLDLTDNYKTSSITFVRRNQGNYWFVKGSQGAASNFPGLASANHCYVGQRLCRFSGAPAGQHFFLFYISNTDPSYLDYTSVIINGRTYPLTRGTVDVQNARGYWTTSAINSADYVTDGRLTLSIQFRVSKVPDRLRFNLEVAASGGGGGGTGAPVRDTAKDINLGGGARWYGLSSDGTTLWFLDSFRDFARAYSASTRTRDAPKDINLGRGTWFGGPYYGTTVWFLDSNTASARAYTTNTRARDAGKDISLGRGSWFGAAMDSTTLWFMDDRTNYARAYVAATRVRDAAKDINLGAGNWYGGAASNGTTLWFVDDGSDYARAYTAATRARDAAKDINLGTGRWDGGGSDGTTIWVIDGNTNIARAWEAAPAQGGTGQAIKAQVYTTPQGRKVGPEHDAAAGTALSATIPNIERPSQSQTYRLVATNTGGQSHRDATLSITQNPTITSCRRTGFNSRAFLYEFSASFCGYPQPTIAYSFSGGQTGTVSSRHYVGDGDLTNCWVINGWRVNFANANQQSATFTARNSSGTATCTFNIN